MNYFFVRFVHPWVLWALLMAVILVIIVRSLIYKPLVYRHSLGQVIKKYHTFSAHPYKKIIYCVRLLTIVLLALIIAKPELVDSRSKVPVEGVDIVLVLDASGSMEWQDYNDDERSRFDIAKAEAIRFIEKRDHDALGLVLFAKDTVSRCPITFDKQLLKEVVSELKIGVIDPDGTMLITGIVTAANRLKYSKAKSKIMIVLTDGEPSEGDMDPSIGIDVAKRLGIKIYTVGIGSEQDRLVVDFARGVRRLLSKVNKELLTRIAQQTGGRYFMAHSAHDMRTIYDTIDQLEKTEHDVPVFSVHYDLLYPLVGTIIGLVFFELFISTFVWFAL